MSATMVTCGRCHQERPQFEGNGEWLDVSYKDWPCEHSMPLSVLMVGEEGHQRWFICHWCKLALQ